MRNEWVEAPDDFLNAVIADVIKAKVASDVDSHSILEIGVEKYPFETKSCQVLKQSTREMLKSVQKLNKIRPYDNQGPDCVATLRKFQACCGEIVQHYHTCDYQGNFDTELITMDIQIGDIIDVYDTSTSKWYESVITSTVNHEGHFLFFCAHFIGKPHFEDQWYSVVGASKYAIRGTHTKGPYRGTTYSRRRPYVGYPKFEISAPGAPDGFWDNVWQNGNFMSFVVKDGKWTTPAGQSYEFDERRITIQWNDGNGNFSILEYMEEDGSLQWITTHKQYPVIKWRQHTSHE